MLTNKIGERLIDQDDKVIHHRVVDVEKTMNEVKMLRDMGPRKDGDWHVARIPMEVLGLWIKDAGLTWDDKEAVQDMIKKKLLSGEVNKFRPHEGNF